MGFWGFIKGATTVLTTPVVTIANGISHFGDGEGYLQAMDNYFDAGFGKKTPTVDKRNQNIDNLNNRPKLGETPAEREVRIKEERERWKKWQKELKELPETKKKQAIKEEAKKRAKEQQENLKIIEKRVDELTKENAQLAAKEREARENGDLATANNYRTRINGNLNEVRSLRNELAKKAKNEKELEAQLKAIIAKSNESLAGNLNWGSWTTWTMLGGLLIALLVIYYFVKKFWKKLKGEQ